MDSLALVQLQVATDSSVSSALISLAAVDRSLGLASAGEVVSIFMDSAGSQLLQALDKIMRGVRTERMLQYAGEIREVFGRIHDRVRSMCAKLNVSVLHSFRRMGEILACLFGRRTLNSLEMAPGFFTALVRRIADALRTMFAWFGHVAYAYDRLAELPCGLVALGAWAKAFVAHADTSRGYLTIRLDDGRYETYNLSPAEWTVIMPLLTTQHPYGHAPLDGHMRSLLTRRDANGDEIRGDAYRLKQHIHAVGRGRSGCGQFFLAPYARRVNTVDR